MKFKEYRIPLPLTLDEYRRGQQWTENELLKETFQTCSTLILLDEQITDEQHAKIIWEKLPFSYKSHLAPSTSITHKKYRIQNSKSKLFDFFLLNTKADFILDEFSFNNWPYTLTILENVEYSLRIFIQSFYVNNHLTMFNRAEHCQFYFPWNNDDERKSFNQYEIINIAERFDEKKDYRIDEDPTRNFSRKKPHLLPLQLNSKWYENWPSHQPSMCVYKLIELILFNEKSLLTKATNKLLCSSILKTQKMIYHRFHQKMLTNIDQWIENENNDLFTHQR